MIKINNKVIRSILLFDSNKENLFTILCKDNNENKRDNIELKIIAENTIVFEYKDKNKYLNTNMKI